MSKYKIENGIYTTLTFHGRSMCWIKREKRIEVKEGMDIHYNKDAKPYHILIDRPLIDIKLSKKENYNSEYEMNLRN